MMTTPNSPTPPLSHSPVPLFPHSSNSPTPKSGRLLIVDDEAELMGVLCEMLSAQGYETAGLTSGADALEALGEQDFDLLLTDLMMPEMDGVALLQAALGVDPHLVGIIMTGQGTVQTAVDAMKVGAFDYILKPFKLTDLLPTLARAMAVRRLRMENLQLRETLAIYELAKAISFTLDLDTILSKVADAALDQCDADEASIMLPTADGSSLYVAVVKGERREQVLGQRAPIEESIAGWAARHRESIFLQGAVDDPRFKPIKPRADIRSAISMPMLSGGKLSGVLNVNATKRHRPFTLGQAKALDILASIAASALENARLYAEVLKLNADLEWRVAERTAELHEVNRELKDAKEEAERANRAKSEFLSRMSHELRTPLNAILGFAQILEMGSLSSQQHEGVEHILKAGAHLLGLINEVLDIARIETGRLSLSPEPVSVSEVVGETLDLVGPMAAGRNIAMHLEKSEAVDKHVEADRGRFKQVLLNLLSNAVKYNREGGIVAIAVEEVSGKMLRIKVSDTGPGIPSDKMGRLFSPFDRLGAEGSGVEGTGLGLALSKRLAEAMGGSIGVESTVGRGSSFWVDLPIAEGPAERVERTEEGRAAPAPASAEGRTLLYVEDNLSNLKLLEQILTHRPSVRLLTATQGRLGLDIARQHRPDLILLDLNLPDVHGSELLSLLRADPRTRDIPVFVISADATQGQIERMLSAGARAYLTKPIDVRQLLRVVDEALK